MILTHLHDDLLVSQTKKLICGEREITLNVVHHLKEIDRRNLFSRRGFHSLFDYAVKELGYSESAAQRRISSMRLLRELPEVEAKVQTGELSLSTLSRAQSFFNVEEIKNNSEKREILKVLEKKSFLEVQKELVSRSSAPEKLMPEKITPITRDLSRLTVVIDEELLGEIEELKNLLARSNPNVKLNDVLRYSVKGAIKKLRPSAPKKKDSGNSLPISAVKNIEGKKEEKPKEELGKLVPISAVKEKSTKFSRYIPVNVKRAVWQRDEGKCNFVDKKSGRKCGCKYGLEIDHIKPFAMGGKNVEQNLRLRCFAHNQLAAIESFGKYKMQQFVPRLR
jgi:hypothetical protein